MPRVSTKAKRKVTKKPGTKRTAAKVRDEIREVLSSEVVSEEVRLDTHSKAWLLSGISKLNQKPHLNSCS